MLNNLLIEPTASKWQSKESYQLWPSGFKYSVFGYQRTEESSDIIPCHLQIFKNCEGSDIFTLIAT